ncbi:MAG: DUF2179 domain-containing protein [Bacteroidales bacterium]|jgi:uncharacterized protein YebE (UPF0316 family)|nr:DUF2179 domain-containing protein [Bacteroidales bacterium]
MSDLFDGQTYQYIVLPIIVFFARICDVTLGTLRIVFVSKGKKNLAPVLGFFEVFIWIVVISQILKSVDNFVCYFAYAGGYAAGNFIGMHIEERIAIGVLLIKVFSSKDLVPLQKELSQSGFGTTLIDGDGSVGKVKILYAVINRKAFDKVEKILTGFDPSLFYVIEDVRSAKAGIFPTTKRFNAPFQRVLRRARPGK